MRTLMFRSPEVLSMSVYSVSATRVRAVACTLAAALTLSAAVASAQEAQPAAAPQTPPAVTFATPAGLLFHQIKADRTADFEWVMERLKEAMLKSENPVHKQQAAGFKVFKNPDALPQTGNIMYVVVVGPAVPEADYSMTSLLNLVYKAFPDQQQDIFKRVSGAFGGATNRINLQPIADFSK
jgi:hypothetical protein